MTMQRVSLPKGGRRANIHESDTVLDPIHRCDRCGVRASVSAYFDNIDRTMLFCRRHWRASKTALIEQSSNIILFAVDMRGDQ